MIEKHIKQVLFVLLVLIYCSCNHCGTKKVFTTDSTRTITSSTAQVKPDFLRFWKTFREAVISKDTNTIISMTSFPFETRGPEDHNPIVKYNRQDFVKVFNVFLQQSSFPKTEIFNIHNTEVPDSTDVRGNWARVGDLEFQKTEGEWMLTFAYLTYDTIDELKNKQGRNSSLKPTKRFPNNKPDVE